ncbi:MAG TPA: membrane protein insertion efficiency factor YidD [Candidatus Wallbacteria bacterium]|nr:membrane protein insertion efficiency factor YidD [Candidatus Wallbacteria bacterium]
MAVRFFFTKPITLYQSFFSSNLPPVCRYVPSCSEYTRHAIMKYGVFSGIFRGMCRILRCNPFFFGGYDPLK